MIDDWRRRHVRRKENVETEEVKEARQLSEEELEKVTGGGFARSFEYGVAHCINLSVALDIHELKALSD